MDERQIEKLLYELHRIGNAMEMLAMSADPHYVPMDESLIGYLQDRHRREARSKKKPVPGE